MRLNSQSLLLKFPFRNESRINFLYPQFSYKYFFLYDTGIGNQDVEGSTKFNNSI